MAKTDNTVTPAVVNIADKSYWIASLYSNDADTTTSVEVKADPSSGNLYLEDILIAADADCGKVSVRDGTDVLFGPFEASSNEWSGHIHIPLVRSVKLTGALTAIANTNGVINVVAQGFTQ